MKNTKEALIWITDILKKYQIPFQISGGLAAIAYGVVRPLADIDIDIPDNRFELIIKELTPYIVRGPARFKGEQWDLLLMTLNYQGQEIDISGIDSTYIFSQYKNEWIKLENELSKVQIKKIFDLDFPVIHYQSLLHYKKILAREVDLIDVEQIENLIKK